MLKNLSRLALLTGVCTGALITNGSLSGGQFSLTGEYLNLKPTVDDTNFVIDNDGGFVSNFAPYPLIAGERRNNDFGYNPGYRLKAAYDLCECDASLSASYSYLKATTSKEVFSTVLSPSIGQPLFVQDFYAFEGVATSHNMARYRSADALYNQLVYSDCGLHVGVFLGVEATEIKFRQKAEYLTDEDDVGTVIYRCKTEGIGPKLGFNLYYPIFSLDCCYLPGEFGLNVRGSGSLLYSRTKTRAFNDAVNDTEETATLYMDVNNEKTRRFIPVLHSRIGISYDFELGCRAAMIEVGYEFTSYLRAISRTQYPDYFGASYSYQV
ncbi:MAG: hypothetical protein KDK62_04690, partial [Chlamydiia bacterium]|nr:hypothetical protein [Chlamydiia bacterium]